MTLAADLVDQLKGWAETFHSETYAIEQNALLASTLGHIVLREELARCLPQLAEVAMRPLVAWLGERGVTSLTLIPCGPLAAFPLLAVPSLLSVAGNTRASPQTGTSLCLPTPGSPCP